MDVVILEQRLEPPVTLLGVRAMEWNAEWCMDQHRVRHRTSLLSPDGRRLLCVLVAPDAEAVRSVLRQVDRPHERVWPATVHAPDDFASEVALGSAGTVVVVERVFAAPVEFASLQDIEDRGARCLERHRVRFLRSYFARDRQRMVCAYTAPDAESVRNAQHQAGMPFESAWTATTFDTPPAR